MELEPAGFFGLANEAVVAEGTPGGVLVHVAHGRKRGASGGLVEAGRLSEPRDPEFHRRVVQRLEEPLGEFLEVTGLQGERRGIRLAARRALGRNSGGAQVEAQRVIRRRTPGTFGSILIDAGL